MTFADICTANLTYRWFEWDLEHGPERWFAEIKTHAGFRQHVMIELS